MLVSHHRQLHGYIQDNFKAKPLNKTINTYHILFWQVTACLTKDVRNSYCE
jgi:hypothetical protein